MITEQLDGGFEASKNSYFYQKFVYNRGVYNFILKEKYIPINMAKK